MLAELCYLLENTILLNKHYFHRWNNQSSLKAAFKILRISGLCSKVYQMDIFDDREDLWSPGGTQSTVGIFFFPIGLSHPHRIDTNTTPALQRRKLSKRMRQ